jgi:hypothetical protein
MCFCIDLCAGRGKNKSFWKRNHGVYGQPVTPWSLFQRPTTSRKCGRIHGNIRAERDDFISKVIRISVFPLLFIHSIRFLRTQRLKYMGLIASCGCIQYTFYSNHHADNAAFRRQRDRTRTSGCTCSSRKVDASPSPAETHPRFDILAPSGANAMIHRQMDVRNPAEKWMHRPRRRAMHPLFG